MLVAAILIFAHCSLTTAAEAIVLGDEQTDEYMPLLDDKRIALFANHSAMVKGEHLLELLLRNGEHVTVLYTPEHGIPYVREAIRAGKSAREIRSMWRRDVESFIEKSKPYLLYERKER